MAWIYTSNFPQDAGPWTPRDPFGFGDEAVYTPGTGWESVDVRVASNSYSRIVAILTDEFEDTDIQDIIINYDLTVGSASGGLTCLFINAYKAGVVVKQLLKTFSGVTQGTGITETLNVNRPDIDKIEIHIRSSQNAGPVYSGSVALNSVVITGNGDFSPFGDYYTVPSSSGDYAQAFSPNVTGIYLFFAMENSTGDQKIVRIDRPTSTNPVFTVVYGPGGGSSANITRSKNADEMLFFGNFGTDIGVIEHTISANSNADISPTSIGSDLIQPLQSDPSDSEHVIAINRTDQDAIETKDGGSNWSTLNAALGITVDAMAIGFFGPYLGEVALIGGNDGTDENLSYSPNSFTSLREDSGASLQAVGSIVSIDRVNDLF